MEAPGETAPMNDYQFRAFLDLLMVSDPWPLDERDHRALLAHANAESGKRGYDGWIHAYHDMGSDASDDPPDDYLEITDYSLEKNAVNVDFDTKRVQYIDVPKDVIREWVSTDSLGRFYVDNIRGEYRYVRLD
jgi:hypothetical protein